MPAILAAALGFGAGLATGALRWNRPVYEYRTGYSGLLYRIDRRTGETAIHWPRDAAWTPIAKPPRTAAPPVYSDLPADAVAVELPKEKP